MILPEHRTSIVRMEPYFKAPMLMLGNQENKAGYKFPVEYKTLDLDGGHLQFDLNGSLPGYEQQQFKTVFNLGTLEHVWNVHEAYCTAARFVEAGGFYLGHSPVAGYEGHGIHVTDHRYLLQFFEINGFEICARWFTEQNGRACSSPERNCGRSIILWIIAQRVQIVPFFKFPQQVYQGGVKL